MTDPATPEEADAEPKAKRAPSVVRMRVGGLVSVFEHGVAGAPRLTREFVDVPSDLASQVRDQAGNSGVQIEESK